MGVLPRFAKCALKLLNGSGSTYTLGGRVNLHIKMVSLCRNRGDTRIARYSLFLPTTDLAGAARLLHSILIKELYLCPN